uniref:phage late control D family protein n=1 Tax=Hymenobacter terrenus TaxID=1629124 RepID=UPI00061944A1
MPRQIRVLVESAGRALPISEVRYLRLHQDVHAHHNFEINIPFDKLAGRGGSFVEATHSELIGQRLTLTFCHHETGHPYGLAFVGIVTEMVASSDNDFTGSVTIKGHSTTCLLADGVQKRTFRNQSLAAIIEQVLQPYAMNLLPRDAIRTAATPVPYAVQYNENNFDFLARLLAEAHEWGYYDGQKLQFGAPVYAPPKIMHLDGYWGGYQLQTVVQPSKVTMFAYDPTVHSHWQQGNSPQADGMAANPLAKVTEEISHTLFTQTAYVSPVLPPDNPKALGEAAKAAGNARAGTYVLLRSRSDNPHLALGDVVQLTAKGLGSDNDQVGDVGKYRITQITHYVDEQGN